MRHQQQMNAAMPLLVACAGGVLVLMLARRRARQRRSASAAVVDASVCTSTFASRACEELHAQGFARVRLTPSDAVLAERLLKDARAFFEDAGATRSSHIPPTERKAHDSRSGYVCEYGRAYLELHPRAAMCAPAPSHAVAAALHGSAMAFSAMCHRLCELVLHEIARSDAPLCRALLEGEAQMAHSSSQATAAGTAAETAGAASVPRAEMANAEAGVDAVTSERTQTFSASMLRVHIYTEDADYPPHEDLGLLTLAPRGSVAGLEVQLRPCGTWVPIEDTMQPNEALLFGGSTLAALGGPAALAHKVRRQGETRLSAPYFLRASPAVALPGAPHLLRDDVMANSGQAEQGVSGVADGPASVAGAAAASVGAFVAQKVRDRQRELAQSRSRPTAPPLTTPLPPPTAATLPPANSATLHSSPATPVVAAPAPTVAVATPVVATATPVAPAAVAVASPAVPARRPTAPARVRRCFYRLDTDRDQRLTFADVRQGLDTEFEGQPHYETRARLALPALFVSQATPLPHPPS